MLISVFPYTRKCIKDNISPQTIKLDIHLNLTIRIANSKCVLRPTNVLIEHFPACNEYNAWNVRSRVTIISPVTPCYSNINFINVITDFSIVKFCIYYFEFAFIKIYCLTIMCPIIVYFKGWHFLICIARVIVIRAISIVRIRCNVLKRSLPR